MGSGLGKLGRFAFEFAKQRSGLNLELPLLQYAFHGMGYTFV